MSTDLATVVCKLVPGERSRIETRRATRTLTARAPGVPVLRWFRDATRIAALAHDAPDGIEAGEVGRGLVHYPAL